MSDPQIVSLVLEWPQPVIASVVIERGPRGLPGEDGREIELQAGVTHIQWRYVGAPSWTNLIALSAIKGEPGTDGTDGREIELQTTSSHIQWRYVGDVSWTNLVALSAITGPPGSGGANLSDPLVAYVRADGDDEEGEIGNPGKPFATGQGAYNALMASQSGNPGLTRYINLDLGVGDFDLVTLDTAFSPQHISVKGKGKDWSFISFLNQGQNGSDGAPGADATEAGANGGDGEPGTDGGNAASVYFSSDQSVGVTYQFANGGGGTGGPGGAGGPEDSSDPENYIPPGQPGGNGQDGGPGFVLDQVFHNVWFKDIYTTMSGDPFTDLDHDRTRFYYCALEGWAHTGGSTFPANFWGCLVFGSPENVPEFYAQEVQ